MIQLVPLWLHLSPFQPQFWPIRNNEVLVAPHTFFFHWFMLSPLLGKTDPLRPGWGSPLVSHVPSTHLYHLLPYCFIIIHCVSDSPVRVWAPWGQWLFIFVCLGLSIALGTEWVVRVVLIFIFQSSMFGHRYCDLTLRKIINNVM